MDFKLLMFQGDRLCNYGMSIKTEAKASRLGANLIACHVEGKLENNVNWAEVDAVEALIEELLAAGYCLNSPDSDNTIGVISPYRRPDFSRDVEKEKWFAENLRELAFMGGDI